VVTEEEVALEVVEGRSSRKEHGPQRAGVCEGRVLASYTLVKRDRRGEGRRTEGRSKGRSYPIDVPVRGELSA
jgi:hypothetical protein